MSLFRVVCKDHEDGFAYYSTTIEANSKKEAKQKASKKCPFLWGYIHIEQYEPEDGEEENNNE